MGEDFRLQCHQYYDDNGDEIILNTGKTMICIIEDGDSFTFH